MKLRRPTESGSHRRRNLLASIVAAAVVETTALWARSGRFGGNVIVRCCQGHLFTTIWIPAGSLKSLRLGPWRVQFCPVGRHWSLVTPVRAAELSKRRRRAAAEHHDILVP